MGYASTVCWIRVSLLMTVVSQTVVERFNHFFRHEWRIWNEATIEHALMNWSESWEFSETEYTDSLLYVNREQWKTMLCDCDWCNEILERNASNRLLVKCIANVCYITSWRTWCVFCCRRLSYVGLMRKPTCKWEVYRIIVLDRITNWKYNVR